MYKITKYRASNGSRKKWQTCDETVSDKGQLEQLRTSLKIQHQAKYVDFSYLCRDEG